MTKMSKDYMKFMKPYWPSCTQREQRKAKLKMRFKGRYEEELTRTLEKAQLLREIMEG